MTSILNNLAADVTAALAGTLHPAVLWSYAAGGSDGAGGTLPPTYTAHACEGLRGSFNAVIAGLSGIPRTDAKVEILASTLPVAPQALDKINIEGEWWIVTERQLDPAGAWWELQCSSTDAVE